MARSFKVIALSVGGLGNRIFNSGDEVFENNFPEGHADELMRGGFLEEIKEPEEKKPVIKSDSKPVKKK